MEYGAGDEVVFEVKVNMGNRVVPVDVLGEIVSCEEGVCEIRYIPTWNTNNLNIVDFHTVPFEDIIRMVQPRWNKV